MNRPALSGGPSLSKRQRSSESISPSVRGSSLRRRQLDELIGAYGVHDPRPAVRTGDDLEDNIVVAPIIGEALL